MRNELEDRRQEKNYAYRKEWSMWQLKQKGIEKQGFGSVFPTLSGKGSKYESLNIPATGTEVYNGG